MTFFFSGELDHRISEAFRPVRSRVESRLNARCQHRDYGDAVTEIAIVPMILGPEFLAGRPERRMWQRKKRAADYRTIIDFEKFSVADDAQRERLLLMNVADAIRHLQTKTGSGFRADDLLADITAEFGLALTEVHDA
ncbi:MAG TPA: Imm44 family immunity protein [Verrucomicrobiae bacterium]|nr:Imm44 family immunity protein [Verrucomicrobiae bacterium]